MKSAPLPAAPAAMVCVMQWGGAVKLRLPFRFHVFASGLLPTGSSWCRMDFHAGKECPEADVSSSYTLLNQALQGSERQRRRHSAPEPTVEEVEAEFWRIIESPEEVRAIAVLGHDPAL